MKVPQELRGRERVSLRKITVYPRIGLREGLEIMH